MFTLPRLISLSRGPSTKQQISQSFENAFERQYNLLILGNSRVYRGLNPEYFSLKAFNFSHDNDSYNQSYYKLKLLIEGKKEIKYLILGVDYFQFSFLSDTRNYIYADYLGEDYLNDFDSNVLIQKVNYHLRNLTPRPLLNSILRGIPNEKPYLKENGQYIRPGIANKTDNVKRDIKRLDIQVEYFNKILDLCLAKNIKCFLVMPPVRENELNSYTEEDILGFNSFLSSNVDLTKVEYLNYSKNNEFSISDYTDITHLNGNAAIRFSKMLNDTIVTQIMNTNAQQRLIE
jgi:hypothetical protein